MLLAAPVASSALLKVLLKPAWLKAYRTITSLYLQVRLSQKKIAATLLPDDCGINAATENA